jgi:viroplasmin and RNaseH domain-containing protein
MATKNNNMRKKYNFMANLYGWKYLFNASEDLKKIKYNDSWRPWDTTRM